jgi:flagellar hook-associated protein 3 FlgL
MRVSTQQMYQYAAASMQRHASDAAAWQQRISSGERLLRASDDPAAASRSVELDVRIARNRFLAGNQDAARARLDAADTALAGMGQALDALAQASAASRNGSYDAGALRALAAGARGALDTLRGLADQRDAFGNATLVADDAMVRFEVEPGVEVAATLARSDVLGSGSGAASPVLAAAEAIVAALSGADGAAPRAVTADEHAALQAAVARVRAAHVQVGVAGARVDQAAARSEAVDLALAEQRGALLGTDLAKGAAELARSQTLLEAARTVFARLEGAGLFERLR